MRPLPEKIVVASHNDGKVREIRALLEPLGCEIVSAAELGLPEPDEDGETFEANAKIKALSAVKHSGLAALSDDSGLCVDALDGKPGIHSARWAGPDKDFALAMRNVEEALQQAGATDPGSRTARFVAVLCLAWPDGETREYRGEIEGQMVWPPRGTKGFGFDPVFLPQGYDITFGEMSADEKHGWAQGQDFALSHRARAFKALVEAGSGNA
ncbi:RdgB/HAM1 family non-canonical purine NTP pyrophosphatase [Tepidamorphus sp. 3E244]|uniref:RdgB/HAM1 family non-canonical purine NTP pyrophosphatase n=1 Tax=Tepidamorphus sp. 3E244 TaxID=3385498 RepID=UPI0038FD1D72